VNKKYTFEKAKLKFDLERRDVESRREYLALSRLGWASQASVDTKGLAWYCCVVLPVKFASPLNFF
jgi:hypothetical protein